MSPEVEALLDEQPWVERLARALVRDSSLADDFVQEAMLAAVRRGPDLRVLNEQPGALRAFLAGVVRNLRRSRKRAEEGRARREALAAEPEALPSSADLLERAEMHRLLVESVLLLGEEERTAILLRYFEGLTAEEIARRSGVPSATIRSRIHRGLERLRMRLEQRVPRQDLFAGLAVLARRPIAPATAAAAGSALPLIGGILAMKTLVTLAAACAVLASFAAGFWFLNREESGARERIATSEAPAQAAEIEPVQEGTTAADPEPGSMARLPVAAEAAPSTQAAAEPIAPRAPRIDGRVVDERGFAVSGAAIIQDGKELGESGPSGNVELALGMVEQETTTTLEVVHPRYARKKLFLRVAPAADIHLGEIALVEAGEIQGWVEDVFGRRLGGANVIAASLENARTDPEELRRQGPELNDTTIAVACAEDGSFHIEGVPVGPARVWAGAEGLAWSTVGPLEVTAGEALRDVRIVLGALRSEDRIAGIVLDPERKPVAGALVHFWFTSAYYGTGVVAEADAEGRFELLLSQQVVHDLSVQDPNSRWSEVYAFGVEPGTTDLVLQFLPERWIDVIATDEDGDPLERFELEVESAHLEQRSLWVEPRYDVPQNGRTRLRVPNAPFVVAASTRGFERAEQGPFEPDAPPTSLAFELVPQPGIRGRVLTNEGEPAAAARLALRRKVEDPPQRIEKDGFRVLFDPYGAEDETQTDADGRFTLYPKAAGDYVIEAETSGHALTVVGPKTFDPREGVELEIALVKGGAIEGRAIVAEGMEPEGIVLVFNRGDGRLRTLRTGRGGTYRIDGLTPGPWEVRAVEHELDPQRTVVSHTGSSTFVPWQWSCEVIDGATTRHDIDLTEWAPGTLEGRFELVGRSTEGWSASLERDRTVVSRDVIDSVPLSADGHFQLAPARAGEYRLVLRGPSEPNGRIELSESVSLGSGSNTWSLTLQTGRLEGSGASPSGARERFYEYRWERTLDGRKLSALVRIVPSENGHFVISTVPEGHATIQRNDPPGEGYRQGMWEIAAEFEVPPGGVQRVELR